MEEKEKEQPQGSTFAERLNQASHDAKKSILDRKNKDPYAVSLSEKDREFCRLTIHLMNDPAYQKMLEYENMLASEFLAHAFDPPPEAMIKTTSFGEQMAFNKGKIIFLNYFRIDRERKWKAYLAEQELLSKKTKGE